MYGDADKDNVEYFVQDGDPSQNSKLAKQAMARVKANVFAIPARSPDLNPIENVFHLVNRELRRGAKTIEHETRDEFVNRIRRALYSVSTETIDKTIRSMDKRIDSIIKSKGERIKY